MSDDVNDYLQAVIGDEFTGQGLPDVARDAGRVRGAGARERPAEPRRQAAAIVAAVDEAADRLGNTRAVARQAYIHPEVDRAFAAGRDPAAHLRRAIPLAAARRDRAAARPRAPVLAAAGLSRRGPPRACADRPPAKMGGLCARSTGSTARSA